MPPGVRPGGMHLRIDSNPVFTWEDIMTRRLPVAITMTIVAILTTVTAAAADKARTVTVTATEFAFEPSTIRVQAGETLRIRLRNEGTLSHNLHIKGAGVHTGTIQGGGSDTVAVTPTETGTLRFFCKVPGHRQAGMKGQLEVHE